MAGPRNGKGGARSGNGCVGHDGARSGNGNVNSGAHSGVGGPRGHTPSQEASGLGIGRGVTVREELTDSGSDASGRINVNGSVGVRIRKGLKTNKKGRRKGVRTRGNTTYRSICGRHSMVRGGHSGQGSLGNHVGSSSRAGNRDPVADKSGVLREQSLRAINELDSNHSSEDEESQDVNHEEADHEDTDHLLSQHDSHVGPSRGTCEARVIKRAGIGFEVEHGDVHKSITRILAEHHDGAWLTFRQIPRDVLGRMFDCFRSRWNWDSENDQVMREGFINVLRTRYRDIMRQMRVKATEKACVVRQDMDPKNYKQFDIISSFPPSHMPHEVWRELCSRWNTPEWLKKSESGSKNRNKGDSSGTSCRHTGGSMGYAERRRRMKRKMNEEPNFKRIFLETHLTKECKKKLWDGDIDIYNLEELAFCTERAKKAYGDYLDAMREIYGDDFSEYPDDPDVWARVHSEGRTNRVYGVGSSDLQYLVTGASSSSSAVTTPSHAEYQRSQEEAQVLRTRMVDLEARLEEERKAREELQQQFQEFMKNWRAPDI